MKCVTTYTVTILSFLILSGNALAGGDAQAGKAVYDSKCKMCHGADGKGNASLAKAMQVTLPDLTSEKVQSKKDAELKKQVEEGGGKMKPVKGLSEQQLTDLIAFTRSLAKT